MPGMEASRTSDSLASKCRRSADSYGADEFDLMDRWLVDLDVFFAVSPEEVADRPIQQISVLI